MCMHCKLFHVIHMNSAQLMSLSSCVMCVLQIELKLPVWYSFGYIVFDTPVIQI